MDVAFHLNEETVDLWGCDSGDVVRLDAILVENLHRYVHTDNRLEKQHRQQPPTARQLNKIAVT